MTTMTTMFHVFQSTLPVRGATCVAMTTMTMFHVFQSTLPVRGATSRAAKSRRHAGISIHAPRAGSDIMSTISFILKLNFNPRSPCGERHTLKAITDAIRHFNPRSPCGERLRIQTMHSTIWNGLNLQDSILACGFRNSSRNLTSDILRCNIATAFHSSVIKQQPAFYSTGKI